MKHKIIGLQKSLTLPFPVVCSVDGQDRKISSVQYPALIDQYWSIYSLLLYMTYHYFSRSITLITHALLISTDKRHVADGSIGMFFNGGFLRMGFYGPVGEYPFPTFLKLNQVVEQIDQRARY